MRVLQPGQFHDARYWLFGATTFSILGVGGRGYSFDTFHNAWTGPHVLAPNTGQPTDGGAQIFSMAAGVFDPQVLQNPPDRPELYLSGINFASSTRLWRFDESLFQDQDNAGTLAIDVEIDTQFFDFGFPQQQKVAQWMEVEYGDEDAGYSGSGSFQIFARTSFDGAFIPLDVVPYDTTTRVKIVQTQ